MGVGGHEGRTKIKGRERTAPHLLTRQEEESADFSPQVTYVSICISRGTTCWSLWRASRCGVLAAKAARALAAAARTSLRTAWAARRHGGAAWATMLVGPDGQWGSDDGGSGANKAWAHTGTSIVHQI
ncbi:hypothetical protein Vafri_12742 [Volvox africanus]|uniref:Uncharacterized protein n=1 Tax=Volvox africanus TaxID=51714 RepID=A0A8J4BAK2_9CHLO|nr:hypothetical protein Vafri_12742 [Volvox africanus]